MAVSLLEARRQILLNTPHIESASGSIATFNTDLSANLTDMKIHFLPVQEGTGDPSPENVRPITGWTGLTVYHSGSDRTTPLEIPISFGRTIYGGYVDLVKGEVVEEWVRREMSAFSSIYGPSGSSEPWNHRFNVRNWATGTGYDRKTGGDIRVYSDCVKSNNRLGKTNYTADDSTANWYIYDNTISTVAEFKEKYAGHYAVYRLLDSLATTYPLTPQTIKSLKGINNIWSDANGDVEVKFWKH